MLAQDVAHFLFFFFLSLSFSHLDGQLSNIAHRIATHDDKFDLHEISVSEVTSRVDQHTRDTADFKEDIARELRGRLETVEHDVSSVKASQKDLSTRVECVHL